MFWRNSFSRFCGYFFPTQDGFTFWNWFVLFYYVFQVVSHVPQVDPAVCFHNNSSLTIVLQLNETLCHLKYTFVLHPIYPFSEVPWTIDMSRSGINIKNKKKILCIGEGWRKFKSSTKPKHTAHYVHRFCWESSMRVFIFAYFIFILHYYIFGGGGGGGQYSCIS